MLIHSFIVLFFSTKTYIKRKQKRNLNIFIMEHGKFIDGVVTKIEDTYIDGVNITTTVSFNLNGEPKIIVVDNLAINYRTIKKYYNKKVKVFLYTNMNYIDIVN